MRCALFPSYKPPRRSHYGIFHTFFLFYFLVVTLLVYYLVPLRFRNLVLLLSSLFFYYWGERVYVVIMFLSTAIDYTHGMLVERCKARGNDRGARMAVASSMVFNLALLFFFKYWDFLAGSLQAVGLTFMPVLGIHLPIGISFYTFQTMSYTIDVYRGDARAQRIHRQLRHLRHPVSPAHRRPHHQVQGPGRPDRPAGLLPGEVRLRRADLYGGPGQKGAHGQQRGDAVGELQGHGAHRPDGGRSLAGGAGLHLPDLL